MKGAVVVAALAAGAAAVVLGASAAAAASSVVLTTNQQLTRGMSLGGPIVVGANKALNYRYELTLTSGGNLEIVRDYLYQDSKSVIWQTHTTTGDHAVISSNGDFVLRNSAGAPLWHSGTSQSGMPTGALVTKAVLDTNGALTLQTAGGTAEWRSSNGLCGKVTLTNGRASTEISAACREVAAHTPYVYGAGHGATPGRTSVGGSKLAFDCSGLTRWAFYLATLHDVSPSGDATNTTAEWNNGMEGTKIAFSPTTGTSNLKAGDFLFFYSGRSHTAIYIGAGYLVEAYDTGYPLRVAPVSEYSKSIYNGAIRTNSIGA